MNSLFVLEKFMVAHEDGINNLVKTSIFGIARLTYFKNNWTGLSSKMSFVLPFNYHIPVRYKIKGKMIYLYS